MSEVFNYVKHLLTAKPRSKRLQELGVAASSVHSATTVSANINAGSIAEGPDYSALQSRVSDLEAKVKSLTAALTVVDAASSDYTTTGVLRFYGFGSTPNAGSPILFDNELHRFVFVEGTSSAVELTYQQMTTRINPYSHTAQITYNVYSDVLFMYNATLYYYDPTTKSLKLSVPISQRNILDARDFERIVPTTIPITVMTASTIYDQYSHILWFDELGTFGLSKYTGLPTRHDVYLNWDTREQWTDNDFKPYTNMIYRLNLQSSYIYNGANLERIANLNE